jgi:hypothetical protein
MALEKGIVINQGKKQPQVAVLIINWNSYQDTLRSSTELCERSIPLGKKRTLILDDNC